MSSVHKTIHIPATTVHQNNLDLIHGIFEEFCRKNRKYWWGLVTAKGGCIGKHDVEVYLKKNEPERLTYKLVNARQEGLEEILTLSINKGVIMNVSNGGYALYGLMMLLSDQLHSVKSSKFIVALRRYWAIITITAIYSILLLQLNGSAEKKVLIASILFMVTLIFFTIFAFIMDKVGSVSGFLLDTKIQYNKFSDRSTLSSFAISSMPTIISLGASIATIATFIIELTK